MRQFQCEILESHMGSSGGNEQQSGEQVHVAEDVQGDVKSLRWSDRYEESVK